MLPGITSNIQRWGALGFDVHFTELDIGCSSYGSTCPGWTPAKAQQQAVLYGKLLQICAQEPACKSFETWGFTDRYTWLGTDQHPLPWDQNYNAKPAATEILAVLQNSTK